MAVDATVGGSTSNSYATRKMANAYFQMDKHPKAATWVVVVNHLKDAYLVRATQLIEAQNIRGNKSDISLSSGVPNQALHFPRSSEGTYILDAVLRAQYEQALYLAESSGDDTRARLQAQGVTSIDIAGDIKETYAGAKATTKETLAPVARAILVKAGLLQVGYPIS